MSEDTAARLVQWTGERTPPAGLLVRLRAIHPRAELVDAGRTWWLGLVEPNPYRRRTGARILRRTQQETEPDPETVRLGQLLLQDFSLVATYEVADGAMVEDFRRRCWLHDHDPAANPVDALLREAALPRGVRRARALEASQAKWRQHAEERAGDVGHALRGRIISTPNRGH